MLRLFFSFLPPLYIVGLALRAVMCLAAGNRKLPWAGLCWRRNAHVTQKEVGSFTVQPDVKALFHPVSPLLSAGLPLKLEEGCRFATGAVSLFHAQVWIDTGRENAQVRLIFNVFPQDCGLEEWVRRAKWSHVACSSGVTHSRGL